MLAIRASSSFCPYKVLRYDYSVGKEGIPVTKRYAQVAGQLAAEIADGVYPLGSTLPSEPALAEKLGVSRSTVRAALGELQKLGMVSRRPSAGTRIEAQKPRTEGQGFSQTLNSIEAIVQYAANTLRDALTMDEIVADRELAHTIGVAPGMRLLRISYRRIDRANRAAPPICWTDVYVPPAYAEWVKTRMLSHSGAVSELVEQAAGRQIAQVEQTLRACGVPASMSRALEARPDSHALEIIRRYLWGANELSLASVSVHPGDRFVYASKLTRAS